MVRKWPLLNVGFRLLAKNTMDHWVWGEEVMITDFCEAYNYATGQTIWVGDRKDICPDEIQIVISMAPYTDDVPLTQNRINVLWLQFPGSIMQDRVFRLADYAREYQYVLFGSRSLLRNAGSPANGYVQYVIADPDKFRPLELLRCREIVFVGNYNTNLRSESRAMEFLAPLVPLGLEIYGSGWEKSPKTLQSSWRGYISPTELPRLYAETKVVLSLHSEKHVQNEMPNTRIMEATSCGACVVSDAFGECTKLFKDSVCWTKGGKDMEEKVQRLLMDDKKADSIRKSSREAFLNLALRDRLIQRLEMFTK